MHSTRVEQRRKEKIVRKIEQRKNTLCVCTSLLRQRGPFCQEVKEEEAGVERGMCVCMCV